MTIDPRSSIHGRMKGSPRKPRKVKAVVDFNPVSITMEDVANRSTAELKAMIIKEAVKRLDLSIDQVMWLQVDRA